MKKKISALVVVIGLVLIIGGIFTKIPNKELTTYSSLSDKYSVIEEYVGGDAYNYIIGASLVGGEIAGAKAQKAIFISVGSLILSIGLLAYSSPKKQIDKNAETNYSLIAESNGDLKNEHQQDAVSKFINSTPEHLFRCEKCGKMIENVPCIYCDNNPEN